MFMVATILFSFVRTSGVAIQVASGAYAPPVSKINNIIGMLFLRMYVCIRIYA